MIFLAKISGILLIIIALLLLLGLIIAFSENDIPQDLKNRPWSIIFIVAVFYLGIKLFRYQPKS